MNDLTAEQQDTQDMSQLAAGHDAALNELMARHAEKLFHYLLRSLRNEEDAADLAQETFVKIYQNRKKFDLNQKFSTWLYTIASNLVKDRYRWRTRHPQVSLDAETEQAQGGFKATLPAPEPAPDQHLQTVERASAVRDAISRLPDQLREPLILSFYENLPQAEIAVILNCSVKAVETRIYRARQQLHSLLGAILS